MQKEFEYTCKTQKEFIEMVVEHKAGFKFSQDADYEIHILYKNGNEFHLNTTKTEGAFSRTGIKCGIISTELEEIHFGNIAELESLIQKFNMVAFWESKSKNDPKAAVVFEFISEMIDKTKTDKYHSNDEIIRMLRGFKFNTNTNFNLCMTLDLHYITEFSTEILFSFSEYMKNQCGYVVAPSEQEVITMTDNTKYSTTLSKINLESKNTAADKNGINEVFLTENIKDGLACLQNMIVSYSSTHSSLAFTEMDESKVRPLNIFLEELHIACFEDGNFSYHGKWGSIHITVINDKLYKWYVRLFSVKATQKTESSASFSGKQPEHQKQAKAESEKAAFIKSAKPLDKLNLLASLYEVKTSYDNSKELTQVFISAHIHSDYAKFSQDFNIISLLTADYSTDSDEKKIIQKLLNNFVKSYRNKTKDVHQSLTHSNIQVCVAVEDNKYIVLKKFNLTIFDIVKIDSLSALHTALEKSLLLSSQDTTSAAYVTEIIAEINSKIIATDNKPIIRNLREFKKLLYSCRGKATAKKCTYNKSNVTNFISGYVLAAYNNRLPKYTALLKPSKNK